MPTKAALTADQIERLVDRKVAAIRAHGNTMPEDELQMHAMDLTDSFRMISSMKATKRNWALFKKIVGEVLSVMPKIRSRMDGVFRQKLDELQDIMLDVQIELINKNL